MFVVNERAQEIISTTLTVLQSFADDPCNSICRGVDQSALGLHYQPLPGEPRLLVPDSLNGKREEKQAERTDAKQSGVLRTGQVVERGAGGKTAAAAGERSQLGRWMPCQWCCSKAPSSPARHSASATLGSSSPENLTQPNPRPILNHPPPLNLPSLMVGPTVNLF